MVDEVRSLGFAYVIFSFDEAAVLCEEEERGEGNSRYQDLIDALSVFRRGVFGIFLDTSSTVTGLLPTHFYGQILVTWWQCSKLFPPLISFPNLDIFPVPEELADVLALEPPFNGGRSSGGSV